MKKCRAIFNDPKQATRFRFSVLRVLSALAVASTTLPLDHAYAEGTCSGHRLLSMLRVEASCQTLVPQVFVTPDRALHASVLQVDVSLYATRDLESRVAIRLSDGKTLTKYHSPPRGTKGYYVFTANWSPDSQFFVYSLTSSGYHSPWSFPVMVFSRNKRVIASFNDNDSSGFLGCIP
jgi:hypothetical protein